MNGYSVNIADYTILFTVMTEGIRLSPGAAQSEFLTKDGNYDLAVNVFSGPVVVREEATAVFRAPYVEEINGVRVRKDEKFWTVYSLADYILIRTSCPLSENYREALIIIRPGEKSWDIIIDSSSPYIDPMCYPLDGLLLYYLTALNGDIFIHGSGIRYNGKAYLFTGRSGKGKSTLAEIFNKEGAEVIHDDRLILRNRKDKFFMYNTPVYEGDKQKRSELSTVYVIDHGESNYSSRLKRADAVTAVMANCIQHHWDATLIGKLTGAIFDLVNNVNIKTLRFVPDKSVVSFIDNDKP